MSDCLTPTQEMINGFPFSRSQKKQQNTVWMQPDSSRPTTLRSEFLSRKHMLINFYNWVAIADILPEGQTMTSGHYGSVGLPKVMDSAKLNQRILHHEVHLHILHGYASAHKTRLAKDQFQKLSHLPHLHIALT